MLTAIDLFSGCGGLSEGLKMAGFDVLAAFELDTSAITTYGLNHPEVAVFQGDVREVDVTELRQALQMDPGELDLLAGCPPCQGYSSLRTRNGGKQNRDAKNGLVREMLRFAEEFLPKAVMMENVPGLEGKAALKDFVRGLEKLEYEVSIGVKNARDFGVPQRRRRLILLAGRKRRIPFAADSATKISVRDSIGKLPPAGGSGDALHDMPEKRSESVRKLISRIPADGGSRSALGKDGQLQCHKDCDGFKDVYGRMAWDKVAPTITGGCFNPSKGRFLHPKENRCITMREAALLQSFPPDYQFDISAGKQAIALMIGNALPPEFIKRHALEIRKILEEDSSNETRRSLAAKAD